MERGAVSETVLRSTCVSSVASFCSRLLLDIPSILEGLDENLDVGRVAEVSRVDERSVKGRGGVDEDGSTRERVLDGSLDRDSLDIVSVCSVCTSVTVKRSISEEAKCEEAVNEPQENLGLTDRRGEDVVEFSLVPSSVTSADFGVGAVSVDLGGLLGRDLVDEGLSIIGAEECGEVDVGNAGEVRSELGIQRETE